MDNKSEHIKIDKNGSFDIQEINIGKKEIKNNSKKCFLITIIAIISSIIIISVVSYIVITEIIYKKRKKDIKTPSDILEIPEILGVGPKVKEFDIITKPGDLKHISVVQKSKDETKINNQIFISENIRKTDYNIYIISEEDPDKEFNEYYTKMYKGCISIISECTSNNGDCQPQGLVDLTLEPKREINNKIKEDSDKMKDNPIALCFFNITDNHIITSIACHESFPEWQKNQILLDLYFFRPPASKRIDKHGDNITLIKTLDEKTNKTFIREINGGLCNIYNNIGSLCTTDMNTTLDSDKNLISYDEEAITTINYNENNSYKKNKVTNLIDVSQNIKEKDVKNFKKSLDVLLPLIQPYLFIDDQFSNEDFADFKERYNDKSKRYIPKKTRNAFRKLDEPKYKYNQKAQIFSQNAKGIKANIELEINPGIDSDIMGAYGTFNFDDKKYIYSNIQNVSIINEIINKLASISKAGNQLAKELYDKIIDRLEQVLNEITIQLISINDQLKYYDIYPIFNSTFSLYPYNILTKEIIQASNNLLSGLSDIYRNIKFGNVNTYAQILYDDIYNYIDEMDGLLINMLNNLGNLTNTLIEKNNTFTAITNYYLNDTSASYVNIIKKMKSNLNDHYIYVYNLIFPKIEKLMNSFSKRTNESLKKNLTSLKELYNNLSNKNYTIKNITNQEYQIVLSNLDNSYKYPGDIINKIYNYIFEAINLKQNGYFNSQEDIDSLNKTFFSIYLKADEVAKKLDNVDLIDKVFDEIMIKFKDNYIYTVNYMEQIKTKNFGLDEDVLNKTSFSSNIKNQMEEEIIEISDEILENIKISNNYDKIQKYLNAFLGEHLNEMNDLISNIDLIFSEEQLRNLADTFEFSLNLTLQKITNEINNNIKLIKQYYNEYYNVINDEEYLIKFIQREFINVSMFRSSEDEIIFQMQDFNEFKDKEYTSAYLSKYNIFMANLNYSQDYLNNKLYYDIVNSHREIYDNINENLQTILKNKLTEKLSDFDEIEFYKDHMKVIKKLNNRLNKYFSQEVFDKKYLKIINESINNNKKYIEEAKEFINSKHKYIKTLYFYDKDNSNDACLEYKRKVCYGCTNCVSYTFYYDRVCFVLSPYQFNYLEVKKIAFDTMKNLDDFDIEFIEFSDNINTKIEKYNSIFNNLTIHINNLVTNEEINNISMNNFEPLQKWINNILENKYNKEIIKSVYDHYQKNIEEKLKIIFDDVFNKWQEIYTNLTNNVELYKEKIKSSLFEFSVMGSIYKSIITQELTENYYNSIILFQRSEFNYSICYYYNYLNELIDKSYKYIINKIQIKENNINDIIKGRKEEIKSIYDILINNIYNSEVYYLNLENQLNILQVNDNNFFKVKYLMEDNIKIINEKLEDMIDNIFEHELDIVHGDEYTLTMRLYLENKELGKLIQTYYEAIDKEELISLNLNKFKDIMKENWVFEEDEFISILNKVLFDSNKVIKNELSSKMKNYSDKIENEINKYFKENIEYKIDEMYEIQIDSLFDLKSYIREYIYYIVDIIEYSMEYEGNEIKKCGCYCKYDKQKLKGRINDYKYDIIYILFDSADYAYDVFEGFTNNMYNNIYLKCFVPKLNQYLKEAKNISSSLEFKEYNLYNSSYKIGEIIYNLTETIVNKYKTMVKKKIDYKDMEYYYYVNNINDILNLDYLIDYVDYELDIIYEYEILYPINKIFCFPIPFYVPSEFDFTITTKTQISNYMDYLMYDIEDEIFYLARNNAYFYCPFDFTNSGIKVFKPICESFKSIISSENQEQERLINLYIQDSIQSNLDNFLNNFIPTFGDPFFERIIDYNINFKIVDLYQNLRYALAQTMLYYYILNNIRDVSDLPYELKIRLYRLNDLDLTLQIKKEDIKQLLERKLSELFEELKDTPKEIFTYYLKESDFIKSNFNSRLLERIDYNLEKIMDDLDKKYQDSLEKYLKEKFISSFNEILEIKTEEMLSVFYSEKNKLMQKFDELFSSKEDNDLKDINTKINLTLDSIQNYYVFKDSFKISNNVSEFFMNYSNSNLLPLFIKYEKDLNNEINLLIMNSINNKSLNITNINPNIINNKIMAIENDFAENHYAYINLAIESYGKTEISYKSNFNYTKKRIYERLINNKNEDEQAEEAKKMVESRDAQETLYLLYNRALNNYNGFNNLNVLKDIFNKINDYENELNIENKIIKELIKENKYNEEIITFLNEKINTLQTKLYNYYVQIYNNLNSLQTDIRINMSSIYSYLSSCENITENVLYHEYKDIRNETNKINFNYSNYINESSPKITYKSISDHMTNEAFAYIYNINEYVEFKSDYTYTGCIWERPKFKVTIINKSKPNKMHLDFFSSCGKCCTEGHMYNLTLNGVNFTTIVEYDMNTSSIIINTYTNIERYVIYEDIYRKEQQSKTWKAEWNGTVVNAIFCTKDENITIYKSYLKEFNAKNFSNLQIIME